MQRDVNSFSDGDHNFSVWRPQLVDVYNGPVDGKRDDDEWVQVPVNTSVECVDVLCNHVDGLCNNVGWLHEFVDGRSGCVDRQSNHAHGCSEYGDVRETRADGS